MLWRQRSVLSIFITLLICVSFLFCSVRITAYAAGPSLPGDALYPLKTTIENARANLTVDHASRVRLHLALASRRLFEMQSLVKERRYDDIVLAVGEFESNIGKALEAAQSLSKADPARATALNVEISNTPLTYDGILMQTLASIPPEIQPAVLGAINASQSAAVLLGGKQITMVLIMMMVVRLCQI